MSPEAIDRRLRDVAQLYRLGMALRDVQWLGPVTSSSTLEEGSTPAASQASGGFTTETRRHGEK